MSTDPQAPPEILIANTESAAKSQLEAAITLWFQYGDAASIHTLAAAANRCYHALGKGHRGTPTGVQVWMQSLSPKTRILANKAQNFFKHGPERDESDRLPFKPEHAELLMLDCVVAHEKLFSTRTPLMTCFFARLAFESPRLLLHINMKRREQGREDITVHQLTEPDRTKYLQEVLPAMTAVHP